MTSLMLKVWRFSLPQSAIAPPCGVTAEAFLQGCVASFRFLSSVKVKEAEFTQ
jgi:hypothetical protein